MVDLKGFAATITVRIIGYDDDVDEMDNDDDLDNEGREGAMLMVEGV